MSKDWEELNQVLRTADEAMCARLARHEARTKRRTSYLLRIHSRLNRIRRARERAEITR